MKKYELTEELKQEAEEYAEGMAKYYASTHEDCIPSQFEKYLRNAYISSAEPREKQITGLSKHILELQKDKGNLIDRCRELEAQIEKMKCCGNCIHCKYDENEESYEYCEKHQQVVNVAIVPCSEWKGR